MKMGRKVVEAVKRSVKFWRPRILRNLVVQKVRLVRTSQIIFIWRDQLSRNSSYMA